MNPIRTFYFLVATQTLSIIGSRMTSIAVAIHIFKDTGSATPLLLTTFFSELPAMLGNSFAGVLVDRWDRKRVLMLADVGQALGSLFLMASFLSGNFQVWHLYAVALVQGIFGMFHEPAKDATTVLLIPKKQRERANAVQQTAFPLAGVAAPVLAGVFYLLVGINGILLIDLATFIIAVVAVSRVSIPNAAQSSEGRKARGNLYREWRGGLRYLWKRPALLGIVVYYTLINFLANGPLELSIPYLMTMTHSESIVGIILAVSSLGAFVGAALMIVWRTGRGRVTLMMAALLVSGVMFVIYGSTHNPFILMTSIFVLMIPLPVSWTLLTSLLIAKTPSDLQGRVLAIVLQMGYIGATLSYLLTGPLADRVFEPAAVLPGEGMGLVLVGAGALIVVLTIGVYALPAIRRLEYVVPDYESVTMVAASGD